jgi:outer membrane protein
MKNIFIFLLLAVVPLWATAQVTQSLSLNDAIKWALNNRFDLKSTDLNALIAQNELDKSKNIYIPDVTANARVNYSLLLQGMLIPKGFGGLPEPQILAFGAKNVTAFGLDISEPIYSPTLKTELSLAQLHLQTTKETKTLAENAVKTKIAEAYYNVHLRQLQKRILEKVKQRYTEYLKITEGKLKNGTALESEYLKTKLDVDNTEIELTKAQQATDFALTYLKYWMNVPKETVLLLTDSLNIDAPFYNATKQNSMNRPEMRLLDLQNQSLGLMQRKVKESFLPTVSAYANVSTQFLNDGFNYSLWKYWNPYSFVGIRASMPLTAKYKSGEVLNEYALKMKQTELDQKQKGADIDFEIEKAQSDMANALLNIKSSKMTSDLSNELHEQQIKQFALGGLLYTNILDTERAMNAAEQNYIKSVYDYYMAKLSLNKATGTFE